MNNSFSKWRIAAFEDELGGSNALLSDEQEDAKHQIFMRLERINDAAGEPLDTEAIAANIKSMTGKSDQEAFALAQEYERNPMHNEFEAEQDEMEPQIENQVTQEQMMTPSENTSLDSTVPSNAPSPGSFMSKKASRELAEIGSAVMSAIKDGETDKKTLEHIAIERGRDFFDDIESIEDLDEALGHSSPISEWIDKAAERGWMKNKDKPFLKEQDEDRIGDDLMKDDIQDRIGKYPGHHGEGKPGDKKHLKGEGPVNEKANEIYHAIMREKNIKGEPSAEEQSSAAAIAWSQAKKNKGKDKKKEKKAFFRGEEAQILDTYRDMWGENISRIRVAGEIIEVPRELIEIKMAKAERSDVENLIRLVEKMPSNVKTASEIRARMENLKIAMDHARAMLLNGEQYSYSEQAALNSVYMRCANELEELNKEDFTTVEDLERVAELPQFEIGQEIITSSFTQHSMDWLENAAEDAMSNEIDDFDKYVREDPILMVSELPETLMDDAGAVRTHAKKRVSSAVAYLAEDMRNQIISKYVENAEKARRTALQAVKIRNSRNVKQRTASVQSVPDEGLFL